MFMLGAFRMSTPPVGPLSRRALLGGASAGAALLGTGALTDVSEASVLVVEARKRVGGRVLNHHLTSKRHDAQVIESGGAFIGPTQDHIAALAKELGVATFLEYNTGNSVYISSTLGRMEYPGTVPP